MDERSTQIREGAGQVESKLNTEFIDWLRKWHMPILLVVALAALSFVGYQRWQQHKSAKVAAAFGELWTSSSPESLRAVAVAHEGVRAVPEMARLSAADAYLRAARTGVKPGAIEKQENGRIIYAPEDLMTEADREMMLAQAETLFREVLTATSAEQAKAIHAINAAYGLAAVAESRGDLESARKQYEEVARLAEWGGYGQHARLARHRIEKLPSLAQSPRLYAEAELPKPPEPPAAPATPGVFDPNAAGPIEIAPLTGEAPGTPQQAQPLEASPSQPAQPASEPPAEPPATPPANPPAPPPG